jgi:hypothetical protein
MTVTETAADREGTAPRLVVVAIDDGGTSDSRVNGNGFTMTGRCGDHVSKHASVCVAAASSPDGDASALTTFAFGYNAAPVDATRFACNTHQVERRPAKSRGLSR